MTNKLVEVVRTLDVDSFQAGSGDAFRFRLEVTRELNTNTFAAKVYRLETYRLQPTFPQSDGEPPQWKHDALVYVVDDMFDLNMLKGVTEKEIVEKFKSMLEALFTTLPGS